MNNLIDVHILHMPNENQNWWKLCEASLENHPINVHNCEGIDGNLYEARRLAYLKGTAPYVSFVDPDDIVLPGTFQKCLDVIESAPDVGGVYTLSDVMNAQGELHKALLHPYRPWSLYNMRLNTLEIHQIAVMRREDVIEYFETDYLKFIQTNTHHNTLMYVSMAIKKPWIAIDFVGYQWRKHKDGAHIIHNGTPQQRKELFATINKIYYDNMTKLY